MQKCQCGNERVFARGLCQACYFRLRRRGTIQRVNVVNGGTCTADGCAKEAFAKNLCPWHYAKAQPPLKNVWKLLRSRAPGQYPPEWDRFEVFAAEIGEPPSSAHQLRRKRHDQPWSRRNMQWVSVAPGLLGAEGRRAYEREWRFRTKFGITVEDYDRMLAEQGGKCAICLNGESAKHKASGRVRDLAVDHDRRTKRARGLLCIRCNRLLGYARDNAAILTAALAYLERFPAAAISGV